MVLIEVKINAELENVTDLQPVDTEHYWYFRVECTTCHVISKNMVTVCAEDEVKAAGGRSKVNMAIACHFCKRESSLNIVEGPFPYTSESSGSLATILVVDCRGAEPKEFEPRGGWKVVGTESKTVFDEVDLTEAEWFDYDEKAALPVSIKYVECSFVVSKKKDIKKLKK